MTEFTLDEVKIGGSIMHVSIEFWGIVVISLLGWVLPLGLGFISSHDEFVLKHTFSNSEVLMSAKNISIDTKIWDWIILIITCFLLLVLVLVASRRITDWITLKL